MQMIALGDYYAQRSCLRKTAVLSPQFFRDRVSSYGGISVGNSLR